MPKNAARQLCFPGYELQDHVAVAINFLREHEPPEDYYVGFSGGKDSITALALCRMANVAHQAFYSCTRIDPPEVMRFIRKEYPQVKWLYPKASFWELVRRNSPPMRMTRWCCNYLKKNPAKKIRLNFRIMGIRAEESARRAKYPRVDEYNGNQTILKPIFYWPEWAVWEFIEAENLNYPILYDWGFSRIGCVICPFIMGNSPAQMANKKRSREHWPQLWKIFEKVVKDWFNAKGIDGNLRTNQKFTNTDDFWRRYVSGGYNKQD